MNGITTITLSDLNGVLTEEIAGENNITNYIKLTFSVSCRVQLVVNEQDREFFAPISITLLNSPTIELFTHKLPDFRVHCRPGGPYKYDSGLTLLERVEFDNINYVRADPPGDIVGPAFCG
jgi:hypothetical protein